MTAGTQFHHVNKIDMHYSKFAPNLRLEKGSQEASSKVETKLKAELFMITFENAYNCTKY